MNKAPRRKDAVKDMMKNFDSLWEQGYTMKAIAQKFNISVATLYNRLGEIADMNGKVREDYSKGKLHEESAEPTIELYESLQTKFEELQSTGENISTAICECKILMKKMRAFMHENSNILSNEEEINGEC